MPRAYGANAKLFLKKEATYGVAPTGNYNQMPFNANRAGASQGLITDPVLGQGREGYPPQLDTIVAGGAIGVPVDLRSIGFWLSGAFGPPTTSNVTTVYTHTFKSGALVLPSFTLEKANPDISQYQKLVGVMVDSLGFNFQRSGFAACEIEVVAQGEEAATGTTGAGTPIVQPYEVFSQFKGELKSAGATLANVVSGSLRFGNNLERVETLRSDGKIDGVDPTQTSVTGEIAVRWADNVLYDKARTGVPIDLEFSYTISASKKLTLTAHEVYLPVPVREITGPGGIEARYAFQGAKNTVATCAMTAVLINDIAGTVYA